MDGFKSGNSDLGGWNLNIHNHYDILGGKYNEVSKINNI